MDNEEPTFDTPEDEPLYIYVIPGMGRGTAGKPPVIKIIQRPDFEGGNRDLHRYDVYIQGKLPKFPPDLQES